MPRYPVYQPSLSGNERNYVNQCLDSTWISSKGEFVERFESSFAERINVQHATSVFNGTVALHLALLAAGVKAGDEVILPTFTYVACANTVHQIGAIPVFADADPNTWQMAVDDIEWRITPRTTAVMVVHLYGHPSDMDAIVEICRRHKLKLVEDCAEAFGSTWRGTHVGGFGDVASFSFFGNKTITTGEGGMVVSRDDEVIRRARHLKNQGLSPEKQYWHNAAAFNYRMTNLQAAIGCAQLERADEIITQKRALAEWYREALHTTPLRMLYESPPGKNSFWMISVLCPTAEQRDPLRQHLLSVGIETRPAFYPVHTMPMYLDGAREGTGPNHYPVSTFLGSHGLNLPSYPDLKQANVNEIVAVVRDFPWKSSAVVS